MEKNKQIKILVTGVGGPAGINASRLLQEEKDVYVYGCDIDELSTGRFFTDEFHVCPRVDDVSYQTWLGDFVAEHNIDLLIPTVHEELPVLRSFSGELQCTTAISPVEALQIGDDKKLMYEWMDVHMPDQMGRWTTLADWTIDWHEDDVQFLKPRKGRGARGCKISAKKELAWLKEHSNDLESCIVMEALPGTEWTVDCYVDKDGTIVYTLVRERVGLAGGISIKGKTVKNEAVITATGTMLSKLECRGPVLIQWKADHNGQPKLVEINPRLSGGLMISKAAGVNPISNMIREYRGETLSPQDWKEVTVLGYLDYKVLEE